MSFEQIGVGETIVVTAFTLLFGAICLALVRAFGLGSRDVAGRLVQRSLSDARRGHHAALRGAGLPGHASRRRPGPGRPRERQDADDPSLASIAMEQGRIAALDALGVGVSPLRDRIPVGIYTIPEIAMVGPGERATELVHIGQLLVDHGGTIDYLRDAVFNYPTLAEAYKVAALDRFNRL
jgi:hypothetical protein